MTCQKHGVPQSARMMLALALQTSHSIKTGFGFSGGARTPSWPRESPCLGTVDSQPCVLFCNVQTLTQHLFLRSTKPTGAQVHKRWLCQRCDPLVQPWIVAWPAQRCISSRHCFRPQKRRQSRGNIFSGPLAANSNSPNVCTELSSASLTRWNSSCVILFLSPLDKTQFPMTLNTAIAPKRAGLQACGRLSMALPKHNLKKAS
jgi:hypothetical protein